MTPGIIQIDPHGVYASGQIIWPELGNLGESKEIWVSDFPESMWHRGTLKIEDSDSAASGSFCLIDITAQLLLELFPAVAPRQVPAMRRETELRWLQEHSDRIGEFAGQWIAISGNELVSHGRNLGEVRDAARQRGIEQPLMFYVPGDEPEISFAAFD